MNKGFFLVFEGGEGTGKSTVAKWLKNELENHGKIVYLTREPGGNGSLVAEKIRDIILDKNNNIFSETEALLFAASRAQHVREVIKPHLDKGGIVICDRFVYSSYAYQGGGRELKVENIRKINELAINECLPDLILLLDLEPSIGLQRKRQARQDFDRLDDEILSFHQKVRETYLNLSQENPKLIIVINAAKPLEEVKKEVWQHVKKRLRKGGSK